ncbi:MAG: DNA-3-methyladenine glycosylase I [Firmicutes bacterium]|nr:DNA-3-methyladenine glycosylase I [Bacillota bacterium]
MKRCPWCEGNELYINYHDMEWGVPVHDDIKHFEFLILESAQAGLNWLTILKKRINYRKAYDNFDPVQVAKYDEQKIKELIKNPGIIRNGRKIEASVNNARRFIEIQQEFQSFDKYIWSFVNNKQIKNEWSHISEVPANTKLSDKISKDLKRRGFKFIGTTIIYSYMQAVGIVNDHLMDCYRYNEI